VTIKSLYGRYMDFEGVARNTIRKPLASMLKSEPCDNDDEMNLFKDLMSALKDPAYNPIDLIKSSRRLEEHLKTTLAEVQLDVLAQCSQMTMSQEVFKQTLFLQITK
jgi:hypothetical protein